MRSNFGRLCMAMAGVLLLVLAGCGDSSSNDGGETAGETGDTGDTFVPDVRPDVPPDEGGTDVPAEDAPPGEDGGGDGRETGREDGGRDEGGGGEGTTGDGSGGCDPSMCSISCMLSGYGEGNCVGDTCECSGEPSDGGPRDTPRPDASFDVPLDGLFPDFGLPDFGLDFGLPDFGLPDFGLPEGIILPDGFELPEGWDASGYDAVLDIGGSCDLTACYDACRAAGHSFGYCDASGACVCY